MSKRTRDDVWDSVEVTSGEGTGNPKVKCLFCSHEWVGGAARCRAHFLGTGGVRQCTGNVEHELEQRELLRKLQDGVKKKVKLPVQENAAAEKKKAVTGPLVKFVQPAVPDDLKDAVATLLFEEGLPFNLCEKRAFVDLITQAGKAGTRAPDLLPNRKQVAGVLLDTQCALMESLVARRLSL